MFQIDDFLIDRVFQPLVIALGIEVRLLCRLCVMLIIGLIFAEIGLAWTGRGEFKWINIILLVLLTPRINSGPVNTRTSAHDRFWRLMLTVLGAIGLLRLIVFTVAGAAFDLYQVLTDIDSIVWAVWLYVSVCRDPPPRGRFAWSGA